MIQISDLFKKQLTIIGTVITVASLAAMAFFAYVKTGANLWLIPLVYIPIPIAWSPLMVGGTAWAAQLANFEEGEALGFFTSATAISSVISAFAAGYLGQHFGYGSVLIVGAISSALAIICFIPLLRTTAGTS